MPLLDSAATVAQGDEAVEGAGMSIYYGVKVSSDLPVGTYSGEGVEYTFTDRGFPASLTTMQGMTHEICESVYTPNAFKADSVTVEDNVPTATLEDIRDHNTYTIAKLADGKCWMTQNLDLNLKTDGTITYDSTNTNLTVAGSGAYVDGYTTENGIITWTPANATINFTGSAVEGWSSSDTAPSSANPGDVYYYTSGSDEPDTTYNSLELCMEDHAEADCKHYPAGNYYNWSAAVASNDSSSLTTQYDNAANSICPAGWRLPKNRNAESPAESNEQIAMITSYDGILSEWQSGPPGGYYSYLEGGLNAIRTNPLWLARSGDIYNSSLSNTGKDGSYWSSTNYGYGWAYRLYFVPSGGVCPAYHYGKAYGYSVRCIAQ